MNALEFRIAAEKQSFERKNRKEKDDFRCLVIDASNKFGQRVENIEAQIKHRLKKEQKRTTKQ